VSEGFFERWARRKADVREGRAVEAESQELEVRAPPPPPSPEGRGSLSSPPPPPGEGRGGGANATESEQEPPLPTLDDVKALTSDSDFSRFVAPEVSPEVKNAALKKLFSDPHYNVMDKMDVYVDDYSKPDPIPEAMLRKLASARFLRLFEEKDKEQDNASAARDVADDAGVRSVAQSADIPDTVPEPSVHDDPDLRLQQDDAPAGEEPERGAG
jgi:hypothetical protein